MSDHHHLIGLLLGTEEDWPTAFESIVRRLGTVHDGTGAAHRYDVERITVEPFDLCAKPRYDLVIDRLAYWYYHPREWLKKAALMDDVYLLNSPFTFQSMEKHAAYCAMLRLGLRVPDTVLVPYKNPPEHAKYAYTAEKYNQPFDLAAIAERLGEANLAPAEETLSEEERAEIDRRLERLERRRAQIGPVNPLAKSEYDEAREHVESLQAQREDTERAMRELETLIRDIDNEIERAFEQTFDATAKNFEEMVEHLFPGGRGRLRRVSLRPVRDEERPAGEQETPSDEAEPDPEVEEEEERDELGVEIEVTPNGKSTRKLSLLSGGEKSLVALAFVFAVFLARPCPFYILDEVEAALDDANIDRFLQLIRRFSDRAQFVIVTHQKRTMDAADVLYGVSMGGDGVSKVVSRKLPKDYVAGAEAAA